jgi:hypothetical protein
MGDVAMDFLKQQLLYQSPSLLIYLTGIILGFFFLRRCSTPALLCLFGCGLLLLMTVGSSVIQARLIQKQFDERGSMGQYADAMTTIAIVRAAVYTVGMGLIVAAVFVGRTRAAGRYAEASEAVGTGAGGDQRGW